MPFLLTRRNVEDLSVEARVTGSCPYRVPKAHSWFPGDGEERKLQQLTAGEAMILSKTPADLKCCIFTMPPIWEGGERKEVQKLTSCYDNALRLAHKRRCKSVAFPLLSADCHGFPKELAIQAALGAIKAFLEKFDITVYLSIREPSALQQFDTYFAKVIAALEQEKRTFPEKTGGDPADDFCAAPMAAVPRAAVPVPRKLEKLMEEQEESFSQRVLRLIDEKGLKDPQVYKRANLDRRLFSKLRTNPDYQPSKLTALSLAVALELNLDQTRELIGKAGYAMTHSSKSDMILEYFIQEENYDIYEINQILFTFDLPLMGS